MSEQNKSIENPTAITEEDLEQVTGGVKYKPGGEKTPTFNKEFCWRCTRHYNGEWGNINTHYICPDCWLIPQ